MSFRANGVAPKINTRSKNGPLLITAQETALSDKTTPTLKSPAQITGPPRLILAGAR